MTRTIQLLIPVPESAGERLETHGIPPSLRGKRIGFLDNTKANFRELAAGLGDVMVARWGAAGVTIRRKLNAATPAAPEVIAALARECDLVFTGSGD
jgi:hypothetical protein